jgi:transposase
MTLPVQADRIMRVVRFGVRTPTRRKAALLDDALRRQTVAYGRALEAVRPDALRWLRADAQSRRANLSEERRGRLRTTLRELRTAIGNGAYRAAKTAATSSLMADAIAQDVLATLTSWIGWRVRFRTGRPGHIRRAEAAQTQALKDLPAAIASLQARRRGATITEVHIRTSVAARIARERSRRPPVYPVGPRLRPVFPDHASLLDALAVSTSKEQEDQLRDALAAQPRQGLHPLSWVRPQSDKEGRGVSLFWDDDRLFAFLPGLLPAKAHRLTKPINDKPKRLVGVADPVSLKRTGGLVLPLSFGRAAWAYLDGWTPRTAKLVKVDSHYELQVAFARSVVSARIDPERWIGIDRGVVNIAAVADTEGRLVWTSGNALAELERRLRALREDRQRRGRAQAMRATRRHYRAAALNEVNRIAKHVAALAGRLGARVSAEDLTVFARGDSRTLSRAQYAHLLAAVERALEQRGYRPLARGGRRVWLVRAAGTSQCCAACGHTSAANRPERAVFRCQACGHAADPDANAAVNIARRGKETSMAHKAHAGGTEGLRTSVRGVVARPASADGTDASHRWSETP